MSVLIGTSGWVYSHWKGLRYPEDVSQDDMLAVYAGTFDAVEVSYSFLRSKSPRTRSIYGSTVDADGVGDIQTRRWRGGQTA